MTTDSELTASSYIAILRARSGLILVVAAICVLVAAVAVSTRSRQYSASADLLVSPVAAGDDSFVGINVLHDSTVAPSSNVLTVARLVKTPQTAALVAARPGIDEPAASLLDRVTVSPLSQTSLVVVTATASSADRAAMVANAFVAATIERRTAVFQATLRPVVSRLQGEANKLAGSPAGGSALPATEGRLAVLQPLLGAPDPTLELLDRAQPPSSASARHTALTLLGALLGGLLLGMIVALLRELTDRRIRREQELPTALQSPVLGRVSADGSALATASAFRDVRTRLFDNAIGPQTVVVTEACQGDGATEVAAQLARSLARAGRRVALVDGDFGRPGVAALFGVVGPEDAFDHVFRGDDLKAALVAAPGLGGNLQLVLPAPAGVGTSRFTRLDLADVRSAIDALHTVVDVVVVDTASLSESSDALLFGEAVGSAVVTVRIGSTSTSALDGLVARFGDAGVRSGGIVILTPAPRTRLRLAAARARRFLHPARQAPPARANDRMPAAPAESTAARSR